MEMPEVASEKRAAIEGSKQVGDRWDITTGEEGQ